MSYTEDTCLHSTVASMHAWHIQVCITRGVSPLQIVDASDLEGFRGVYAKKKDFTASPSEQQLGTSQMLCSSTSPLLPVQEDHIFITSGCFRKMTSF